MVSHHFAKFGGQVWWPSIVVVKMAIKTYRNLQVFTIKIIESFVVEGFAF